MENDLIKDATGRPLPDEYVKFYDIAVKEVINNWSHNPVWQVGELKVSDLALSSYFKRRASIFHPHNMLDFFIDFQDFDTYGGHSIEVLVDLDTLEIRDSLLVG